MFIRVTPPDGLEALSLLAEAIEHRVAFVPGAAFHVDRGGTRSLRVDFTNGRPERIREGVARLAAALDRLAA